MQTSFDFIATQPDALTVLAALCLYEDKCATIAQLENRLTLDTDAIEDALEFLKEHEYIVESVNAVFYIMQKGVDCVNQQTYSDFKLI